MGETALRKGKPHAGGNRRAGGGVARHREQMDQRRKLGTPEGIGHDHQGGTTKEPVPTTGRAQRQDRPAGTGTAVSQRRGSGYHLQAGERHQEDGNGGRTGGYHVRVRRPAQMVAYLRRGAGQTGLPAAGRFCQIKTRIGHGKEKAYTTGPDGVGRVERTGRFHPGKLGHQPGGFHRRDRGQKKRAGGGRRGMVPLLLRTVLHLRARRLPQKGDTAHDGA